MKKYFTTFLITLAFLLATLPFFLNTSKAGVLGEGILFLERMQIDSAASMTVMFTPGSDFTSVEDNRSFRIIFPQDEVGTDEWCLQNNVAFTTITPTDSSPVEQGAWNIDAALPVEGGGPLVATCHRGSANENDYIEITGIGNLAGGTSYGFTIASEVSLFKTGKTVGNNLISFQLTEGDNVENLTFGINLLASDQVTVTAEVLDVGTITCNLSTNTVNLGNIFPGGVYVTGGMSLTTESTMGFYWAVYGDGDGTNAGLYTNAGGTYLLSSEGVEGQVNLLTGEGFGMLASSNQGYVPLKYTLDTSGIFGSISSGVSEASVFLYADEPTGAVNTSISYGVRAGSEAQSGSYEETLTYICGGYVGATAESGSIEEAAFLVDNPPCEGETTFTDSRDSQTYDIVEIGDQCWFAENLAYLPSVVGPGTGSSSDPYYYVYDYNGTDVSAAKATSNYQTYGVLYNWPAAMAGDTVPDGNTTTSVQGICPTGWSLPSDFDYYKLEDYLATGTCNGSRSGAYDCDPAGSKLAGKTSLWNNGALKDHPDFGTSGFEGLPGGFRGTNGSFNFLGTSADFWSSSPSGGNAWRRDLDSSSVGVNRSASGQANGLSVRCLRD